MSLKSDRELIHWLNTGWLGYRKRSWRNAGAVLFIAGLFGSLYFLNSTQPLPFDPNITYFQVSLSAAIIGFLIFNETLKSSRLKNPPYAKTRHATHFTPRK